LKKLREEYDALAKDHIDLKKLIQEKEDLINEDRQRFSKER
jgi:chromosome segregation ATPase